jgi:hypothetical protein
MQEAPISHHAIFSNRDAGLQLCHRANLCSTLNDAQSTDPGGGVYASTWLNHCAWVNQWAFGIVWRRTCKKRLSPQLRHFGEVQIGLLGNYASTSQKRFVLELRTHDHASGFGVLELLLVPGVAYKT